MIAPKSASVCFFMGPTVGYMKQSAPRLFLCTGGKGRERGGGGGEGRRGREGVPVALFSVVIGHST